MSLVAEADACLDSIEDIEGLTPRQWPQCHRTDASPSRSLQEGFAQLLDKWMRHPEHRIRLKCINRMGHLCNFLLDILCILGVRGMTFCIARLHSLSTFFVDYLRIDPHLDACFRIAKAFRQAIAWPASTWPLSSLSPHFCQMSNFALGTACMQTCNHAWNCFASGRQQCMPSPSQPEPSSASAFPPGLPQPASQRHAPYCVRFQADNFYDKACKASHVCSVPDCAGNQD